MKAATIKKLPLVENYYCYMYSNPCMADTDLDSYDDYVEEYIGTSPISVWNSLDTSGIINGSMPSGFSFNNWWDWQELIEEHAWNYIHNAVEEDIVTKQKGKRVSVYTKNIPIKRLCVLENSSRNCNHWRYCG